MATNDYVLDKAVYQAYQEDLITEQMPEAKKEEFNSLVRRAIKNELPEDDAIILRMYFFNGFTTEQIAKHYGCNHSTISRRIHKSLDVLYHRLKYAAEYRFGVTLVKKG